MEIYIIEIVLSIVVIGILWHIFVHLMAVFHNETNDIAVKAILENPSKYVRYEHMCYVLRNFIYLFFAVMLLVAACKGNINYSKQTIDVEVDLTKN